MIMAFMIVVLGAVSVPTIYQVSYLFNRLYHEAELTMRSDLEVCALVLDKKERGLLRVANTMSRQMFLGKVLEHITDPRRKVYMIRGLASGVLGGFPEADVSYLTIVDRNGDAIFRNRDPYGLQKDNLGDDPFVQAALAGDEAVGYAAMTPEQLIKEHLISEDEARSAAGTTGLFLTAAAPVFLVEESSAPEAGSMSGANRGAIGAVIVGYWFNQDQAVLDEVVKRTRRRGAHSVASIYLADGLVKSSAQDRAPNLPDMFVKGKAVINDRIRNFRDRGEIGGYMPLRDINNRDLAILELRTSTETILQTRAQLLRNIILFVAFGLLLAMLLGTVVTRRITGPIMTLNRGTEEIGRGNLKHRIQVPGADEISQLAEAFNVMAIRLQQSMDEMKLSKQQVEDYSNRLKSAHASLEMYSRELEKVNQQLLDSNIKLQKANEVKDTFLSMVSHELKTPLTTIIGYVSMILEGVLGGMSEEQIQALEVVLRRGRNLQDLIADLLSISRLDAGKLELRRRYLDMPHELRNVEEVFRERLREAELQILLSVPEHLPRVNADGERLGQVLFNLVGNAIKFTPPGGTITIRVSHTQDSGQITIAVSDTGIGIPEAELSHIFERFYQVDRRDGRQYQGTGLGLAICKELVELHGGRIWAESGEGKGSTFTFTLPIS